MSLEYVGICLSVCLSVCLSLKSRRHGNIIQVANFPDTDYSLKGHKGSRKHRTCNDIIGLEPHGSPIKSMSMCATPMVRRRCQTTRLRQSPH